MKNPPIPDTDLRSQIDKIIRSVYGEAYRCGVGAKHPYNYRTVEAVTCEAAHSLTNLIQERDTKLEYEKRVADNCRAVANAPSPMTWLDPVTNKKLYNQAHLDKLKEALLGAVGPDEPSYTLGNANYAQNRIRNELRAQTRTAINRLFESL